MELGKQTKIMEARIKDPDNTLCADCGTWGPQWISISYGVLVCL